MLTYFLSNCSKAVSLGTMFQLFHRFNTIFCENAFVKAAVHSCSSNFLQAFYLF